MALVEPDEPPQKSLYVNSEKLGRDALENVVEPLVRAGKASRIPLFNLVNTDKPSCSWGKALHGGANTYSIEHPAMVEHMTSLLPSDVERIPDAVEFSEDDGRRVRIKLSGWGQFDC